MYRGCSSETFLIDKKNSEVALNVGNLAPGIYFASILLKDGKTIKARLVKK